MATKYMARCQPVAIGRCMIMKHALGCVQDLILAYSRRQQSIQHKIKVTIRKPIRAHIFSSIDSIKDNAKLFVTDGETHPVHIGENHRFVMLLEIGESFQGQYS